MSSEERPDVALVNGDKRWFLMKAFGELRKGHGPEAARYLADEGLIIASVVSPDDRWANKKAWEPREADFRQQVHQQARWLNQQLRPAQADQRIITVVFDPLDNAIKQAEPVE